MKPAGFSQRTVLIVGGLCAVSLITGLVLSLFQEEIGVVRSPGTDTFSYSALGHRGLRELLETRGDHVIVSRSNSGFKTGESGALILAEPDLEHHHTQRSIKLMEMIEDSYSVLIVLPKHVGDPDPHRPAHIASTASRSLESILAPLKALDMEAELLLDTGHSREQHWTEGEWPDRPFIDHLQLLQMPGLEPLMASEKGILLGRLAPDMLEEHFLTWHEDILILSDPDLMANHGLGKGNNGAIMLKIIDQLRDQGGVVVFDETLHGHEVSPSIFRSFFRFPLVFVLLQLVFSAVVMLWMATGRFGSPAPAEGLTRHSLDYLLDNTAELLEFGGHGPFILGRYFRSTTANVCRRLHLEMPGSGKHASDRLIIITQSRSPEFDFAKMSREVPATAGDPTSRNSKVLTMARAIWNWQREMTHGL